MKVTATKYVFICGTYWLQISFRLNPEWQIAQLLLQCIH